MQLDDLLNRRELLDSLETEPLVDYLQKHGVLDQECCSKILSASESFDRNRQLLHSLMKYRRPEEDQDLIAEPANQTSDPQTTTHDVAEVNCYIGVDDVVPEEELKLNLNAFGLFMNALRHTGYHRLASLLDNERRIHKPIIGSRASLLGYHARSRRNGQIGIILQVGAVKVSAPEYGLDLPAPAKEQQNGEAKKSPNGAGDQQLTTDWINLADFGTGGADEEARRRAASYPDFRAALLTAHLNGEAEEAIEESTCCLCCCFRKRKRKPKRRPSRSRAPKMNGHSPVDGAKHELQPLTDRKSLTMKSMSDDQIIKAYKKSTARSKPKKGDDEMSEEARKLLQMKADILNEKSEQFYKVLFSQESAIHENLLKYFEQERGVLVLDCFFDDAFMVVAICTKRAKLMALKADLESGTFCRDLEQCLVQPDVLATIGVKAMKLAVDFDDSEFREALAELS